MTGQESLSQQQQSPMVSRVDVFLTADRPLSEREVVAVARDGAAVTISTESLSRLGAARQHIDTLAAGAVPSYGISTGFGALARSGASDRGRSDESSLENSVERKALLTALLR